MSAGAATAAVHLLPTLVWAIVAGAMWRIRRELGVQSARFTVLPLLAALGAVHNGLHALRDLTPTELAGQAPGLHGLIDGTIDATIVGSLALFRHFLMLLAAPEATPSRRWLAVNYGVACLVVAAVLPWSSLVPFDVPWGVPPTHLLPTLYAFVVTALAIRQVRPLARRGLWRPGPAVGELRSPDLLVMATAVVAMMLLLGAFAVRGGEPLPSVGSAALHALVGLALVVPIVARVFGRTVRAFLTIGATLVATAAVYVGGHALAARTGNAEAVRLVDIAAVALLVFVVAPGRAWLRGAIERVIFRRRHLRQAELQAFMGSLSPELGTVECCRRGLAELRRVMGLRGVAVVLGDGTALADGAFRLAPITRVWPTGSAAEGLPARPFNEGELLAAFPSPLREALVEAEVVWVTPIASPRRRWGHVFATEGLLTTPSSTEDLEEVIGFVAQLALVLDASELLARAVAVERSLAHAEKLAAIGETAARIAHDIRNPVAAARSLAQQLAREPGAPFSEELEVILGELGRIEERVAALLRFARREELRLESVDLGELARTTADAFRARLTAEGIALALDVEVPVRARADREKLRQVLVNLIENAIDVLTTSTGSRRVAIAVGGRNGSAAVRVADTGPGVEPDALPRLFEPFFSLKPHGTGLGLAIAKRTIDAHGGRIGVTSTPGTGTTFEIELPVGT